MSGGFFNYENFHIGEIAAEIDRLLGANKGRYSKETLRRFEDAAITLKRAERMAYAIGMLVSGDDDEESFTKRWESYGL
jgi:hypothetical protein